MLGVAGASAQFVRHTNLSECCVPFLPSVDIERDIVSKSGAGNAGVYFFVVKSHRPLWNFRTSICLLREIL
jgi:hypothetical protein